MKKNYIYSLAATFITAALAMGSLTACSVDDIFASHHNAQAKTYTVSIPASIGEGSNTRAVEFGNDGSTITTSFENTDKIYVALEHEGNIIGFGHTGSGSSGFMPLMLRKQQLAVHSNSITWIISPRFIIQSIPV